MNSWRGVPGRHLALAKSHLDVVVDLLKAVPQLIDSVDRGLNASGQVAHLRFQAIHAQFGVDRRRSWAAGLDRSAAIDLPLQHAEIPLQAIQAVLYRPVLRTRRRVRHDRSDKRQQEDWAGMAQDGTPYHREPLEIAREPWATPIRAVRES